MLKTLPKNENTKPKTMQKLSPLMQEAVRVFGEEARAIRWLNNPNRMIEGEKPINLLKSATGQRKVQDLLIGIEEGMYS